jgi:hypothetical protein
MSARSVRIATQVAIVAALAAGTAVARRRGYGVGGRTVVRCRRGHLFTTIWLPGGSFKSIRLGWWRVQWCPVGRHVSLVVPVKEAELSDEQREFAALHRDSRIP